MPTLHGILFAMAIIACLFYLEPGSTKLRVKTKKVGPQETGNPAEVAGRKKSSRILKIPFSTFFLIL